VDGRDYSDFGDLNTTIDNAAHSAVSPIQIKTTSPKVRPRRCGKVAADSGA
jgi:hypothetical protein